MSTISLRPETGLDPEFLRESTAALQAEGLQVYGFIPGDALLRGPLYKGLPTLEAHRTAAPSAAFADLALNYGLDGIFAGDPEVSTREQEYIRHFCTTGELCLPVALRPGYETLYDRTFTCRPDSPKTLVRYQESRLYSCFGSTVQPDNCAERRRRCVTMDNIGFKTFTDDFTEQQGRELTKNLAELRSHILGEITKDPEHAMTKTRLEKIIYSFHHPRSLTTGRHVRSRESLGDYIARFTHEMEDGTRLNIHKLRYGASTIKNYKGFIIQFDEFCKAKRKRFDFGDIDLKFYDDFVAWFTAKDYSINTIGRHVKELKIIMRAAREEGLHDNGLIESRKFRVLTADVENIYLTESEIRAIANLDLSDNKHKDIARDVFLVGCYTAQRFSDYSTINEGNIRTLESGQLVIDLKQQKTGNHVIIPVRPELQAILDKYENRLPKSYEQKVNKFIKEITREAGITEKIEVSYVENGERKTHLVEKCDLVKTHTARRSGATNMYLAGIPTIAIMKITGHKTEKEFMKYIKITEEQTAMELMNHPYFSGR